MVPAGLQLLDAVLGVVQIVGRIPLPGPQLDEAAVGILESFGVEAHHKGAHLGSVLDPNPGIQLVLHAAGPVFIHDAGHVPIEALEGKARNGSCRRPALIGRAGSRCALGAAGQLRVVLYRHRGGVGGLNLHGVSRVLFCCGVKGHKIAVRVGAAGSGCSGSGGSIGCPAVWASTNRSPPSAKV